MKWWFENDFCINTLIILNKIKFITFVCLFGHFPFDAHDDDNLIEEKVKYQKQKLWCTNGLYEKHINQFTLDLNYFDY